MTRLPTRITSLLTAATVLTAPLAAHAQSATQVAPPATQAPPSAVGPNGEYVAPLQQQTQPSYLPQSVALSGPRMIRDYNEGDPVPYGYHPETRARTGMVVGGAVLFGTLYFFSLVAAATAGDVSRTDQSNPLAPLYVPAVGPFIQMTRTDSSTGNLFLAIDGLGQTAGALMFIYGLASPKNVLVRNDLAGTKTLVMPTRMGKDGYGLSLTGTF